MKKTVTLNYLKYDLNGMQDASLAVLYPQKKTMDFLMQYARSYYVESHLSKQLSGMILN